MLEIFGWDAGMSLLAALILVAGALLIGVIAQFIGTVVIGYQWAFTSIAALVGGWLGSEAFGTASTWGPAIEGLYVLPALIGAIVLGGVVDFVIRTVSGGSLTHHPRPI